MERAENPQHRSEEVQGSHDRRACGGEHMAGGGRGEVAKMVAAGNRVRLHSNDPRRNQQEAWFSPAGLSPGVCVTDEGQTMRPVGSEGLARECKWFNLIL